VSINTAQCKRGDLPSTLNNGFCLFVLFVWAEFLSISEALGGGNLMTPEDNKPTTSLQKVIVVLVLLSSSLVIPSSAAGAKATRTTKAYSHTSLRAMARVYMATGSYGKAQPLLENALDLARASNAPDSEVCACTLDLAYLYKSQGKLAEAETTCLSGLQLQEKVYSPKHPYVAYTLRILGEIYRRQRRYREASDSLERAMTIMRGVSSENDPDMAPIEVDMARLLVAKGDFAQAESYFKKAIAVIESSYGPTHLYTTRVLTSIAELRVLQGRYVQAEALVSRALPVQERIYGANPHFLVPAWLVMSQVYKAKGDLASAKALLAKSLRAAEKRPVSGRLILVLETLVQLHSETGNTKEVAKLQRRIRKLRASKQFAYIPTASVIR
jgi:tetratricopeptide (TPR) repeat protein